ncbi:hypothetical protein [Salinilacihabitans rarus]|uniref:hypothetical protein n=1 Tax=Salinilacihabitans rarus TaxID=2961596 RepID=UPI0020C8DA33|nr:hypothetical protein [Salinilacihabitans rarus]
MTIPGYDPDDVAEVELEREADAVDARVSVVAGVVPEAFAVEASDADPPPGALSPPVDLVGLDGLAGVEALRIELAYDPSKLPPGASPTDVAVAVVAGDDREVLDSEVDLDGATVSAVLADRPPGETVAAVHDAGGDGPE